MKKIIFALISFALLIAIASAIKVNYVPVGSTPSGSTASANVCKPEISFLDLQVPNAGNGQFVPASPATFWTVADWDKIAVENRTFDFSKNLFLNDLKFAVSNSGCTLTSYTLNLEDTTGNSFIFMNTFSTKISTAQVESINKSIGGKSISLGEKSISVETGASKKFGDFLGSSGKKELLLYVKAKYSKGSVTGETFSDKLKIFVDVPAQSTLSCNDSIAICLAQINKKLVDRFAN